MTRIHTRRRMRLASSTRLRYIISVWKVRRFKLRSKQIIEDERQTQLGALKNNCSQRKLMQRMKMTMKCHYCLRLATWSIFENPNLTSDFQCVGKTRFVELKITSKNKVNKMELLAVYWPCLENSR